MPPFTAPDSRAVIPGLEGAPAFTLAGPSPSALPVLISVPHAGRAYPPGLAARMRHGGHALLRLEDRFADLLAEAVAQETGAMLIIARAPRAMIDLNRAPDDIDWGMIAGGQRGEGPITGDGAGRRARSGLGLIPRRLPGLGELWKTPHSYTELAERIARIHEPYHAETARCLRDLRNRWGAALLLDLHSMPSLPARGGSEGAEFVLGDRFGSTCDGGLVASAFSVLAGSRRLAAHNRPYAGGFVLERHGAPARGIHALQLEIDRRSYLDAAQEQPGPGLLPLAALVARLVRRLGEEVRDLGQARPGGESDPGWAEAAE